MRPMPRTWPFALAFGVALALAAGGCRRVPAPTPRAAAPAPAAPAAAPATSPAAAEADRAGEVYELRRRVAAVEARLRGLEAAAPADGGAARTGGARPAVAAPAVAPGGPTGPTGATGAAGPPGPALRLESVPEKGEVYHRRAEQGLEPGETGAAVARCAGVHDALVSGACSVTPAPLGVLAQAGAYGLDDPKSAAGWRCEYRNASPRHAITARAEAYCVPRTGGKAAK
jgi:hypothetical protein